MELNGNWYFGNTAVAGAQELTEEMARTVTSIGGYVDVSEGATLNLPVCTSIGGSVYVSEGATLDLPVCTSIDGSVYVREGATLDLPVCTSIGGYVYVSEGATLNLPGSCKKNDPGNDAKAKCLKNLAASFLLSGYLFADGILSKQVSVKNLRGLTVHEVVICGKTDTSYVIERDGVYSHGATIQEAKESLIFKISDRDTSRFKSWTLDTQVSAAEAIASYRAITGACEFGTREFCAGKDLERNYTVAEVIKMTTGKYGCEQYKGFFQRAA